MRKVHVFDSVSLDGFFTDGTGDMSWAHKKDAEWNAFVAGNANASDDGALLFGRVTYQQMAAFWPTSQAQATLPEVAAGMNRRSKYVVSRTLDTVEWANTTLLRGDAIASVRALKAGTGSDVVILGSGSLVSQLTEARLIDSYQLVLNPVVLGQGRTLFATVRARQDFTLTKSKAFSNGNVVLWYEPA